MELEHIRHSATAAASLSGNSDTSSSTMHRAYNTNWANGAVFLSQVIIVYAVIIAAIANLTFFPNSKHDLWITLLSSSIGYLLPSPNIKRDGVGVFEPANFVHATTN
jgi:hypothetical protein